MAKRVGPIYGRLVASPGYVKAHGAPTRPQEILDHEVLMQGTETWQFQVGEEIVSVRPHGRFKADNGAALLAAARVGLGIAWLPDGITLPYLTSGELVPVMPDYPAPPAGAFVVRPPSHHPARKISVLTDLLIEHCEKAPLRWGGAPPKRMRSRAR